MQSSKMSRKSIKFNFLIDLYTLLYNRPHWNVSIGTKDTGSWRVAKTYENKDITVFVWLYLKIGIMGVTTQFNWSHHMLVYR